MYINAKIKNNRSSFIRYIVKIASYKTIHRLKIRREHLSLKNDIDTASSLSIVKYARYRANIGTSSVQMSLLNLRPY